MPESTFTFKQFIIRQDKCAMKISTDGVLFGAVIQPENAKEILDIGTGTGLLSLMIAQRSDSHIDAIDIDKDSYLQASENIKDSKWNDRIDIHHIPLQDFVPSTNKKYDLIITNPPYFIDAYRLRSDARSIARHMDETLSMDELINGVLKLLKDDGKFWLILPYKEGMLFYGEAFTRGLYCYYLIRMKPKADKHEKRLIMAFSKNLIPIEESEIVVHYADNNFTKEYIDVTREYYLHLNKQPV